MPADLSNSSPDMDPTALPAPDAGADAPGMDASTPDMGADTGVDQGPTEGDGATVKQELIKLANYATNLQDHIEDNEDLDAWIQSKIAMAATNIASVYHHLAYEKKIGEYGEKLDSTPMSESMRITLQSHLLEAKMKVKELKKTQAAKVKVLEGPLTGGEQPCDACGGSGSIHKPGITPHPSALAKVEKYKTLIKATKAAHKRMDNQDGAMSPESEVDEDMATSKKKPPSKKSKKGDEGSVEYYDRMRDDRATGVDESSKKPAFKKSKKGHEMPKKDVAKGIYEGMNPEHIAHHHACEYAKHHKTGNLDLAMHHKDECEKHGGAIKHDAMGECYHTHARLNGGQPYKCNPIPLQTNGTVPTQTPQIAAEGAHASLSADRARSGASHPNISATAGKSWEQIKRRLEGDGASPAAIAKAKAAHSAREKSVAETAVKKVSPKSQGKGNLPGQEKAKGVTIPSQTSKKVQTKGGQTVKEAAASMWKNLKETTAYMAEKKVEENRHMSGEGEFSKYAELGRRMIDWSESNHSNDEKMLNNLNHISRVGDKLTQIGTLFGPRDISDHDKKVIQYFLAKSKQTAETQPQQADYMTSENPMMEGTETDRILQLTGRLNRSEKPMVTESREVDEIRALTQRLLG
jgi:hypothetical protein